MSINPVQSFGPQDAAQSAEARAPRPQPSSSPRVPGSEQQSNLGTRSNEQALQAQKAAEQEQPQDVVQVRTDSQLENQIVIKYTDQATGRTILQVPSSEVLSVALGISEDLRHELRPEATSTSGTTEGEKHGH
ncbi:MAG TPA: hypothetical protein VKF84_15080 [Candidatus Sulfotelmatobacter sp.]|nr:hypothetical protein [Candidatus Sulfotelmatobacter sp.]